MTTILIFTILLLFLSMSANVYIFHSCRKIEKSIKTSEKNCMHSATTCLISTETIEDISHEQEVYFKKFVDKYRLKFYAAINQYTQNRKEKNKKFTYKTKMTNNPTRSKKR